MFKTFQFEHTEEQQSRPWLDSQAKETTVLLVLRFPNI